MANTTFNSGKYLLSTGGLDFVNGDIRVILTNGYVVDQSHSYVSDIISYEISGSGYSRKILENKSVSIDTVNNRIKFTADDVTWSYANFTADGAVVYLNTGDDNTSSLITFLDFGTQRSSSNTDFKTEWSDAEGIMNIR